VTLAAAEETDATFQLLPGAASPQGPAASRLAGRRTLAALAVVVALALALAAFWLVAPGSARVLLSAVSFQQTDANDSLKVPEYEDGKAAVEAAVVNSSHKDFLQAKRQMPDAGPQQLVTAAATDGAGYTSYGFDVVVS